MRIVCVWFVVVMLMYVYVDFIVVFGLFVIYVEFYCYDLCVEYVEWFMVLCGWEVMCFVLDFDVLGLSDDDLLVLVDVVCEVVWLVCVLVSEVCIVEVGWCGYLWVLCDYD